MSVGIAKELLHLFWPEFVRANGCVFAAFQGQSSLAEGNDSKTGWESFINHTHIMMEFSNAATFQHLEKISEELTECEEIYDDSPNQGHGRYGDFSTIASRRQIFCTFWPNVCSVLPLCRTRTGNSLFVCKASFIAKSTQALIGRSSLKDLVLFGMSWAAGYGHGSASVLASPVPVPCWRLVPMTGLRGTLVVSAVVLCLLALAAPSALADIFTSTLDTGNDAISGFSGPYAELSINLRAPPRPPSHSRRML